MREKMCNFADYKADVGFAPGVCFTKEAIWLHERPASIDENN